MSVSPGSMAWPSEARSRLSTPYSTPVSASRRAPLTEAHRKFAGVICCRCQLFCQGWSGCKVQVCGVLHAQVACILPGL